MGVEAGGGVTVGGEAGGGVTAVCSVAEGGRQRLVSATTRSTSLLFAWEIA